MIEAKRLPRKTLVESERVGYNCCRILQKGIREIMIRNFNVIGLYAELKEALYLEYKGLVCVEQNRMGLRIHERE